ncbi:MULTISPECIES: hypothetical protein [Frankia]|uniref:Uncharacterized protein n=1 Tax=Frankia alni (strain DSM 45986 / CECT 9034 / ACN14a) TaxID=326424 RepID=Q0RIZ8_FRAAA|nr:MULTISPECIES: hypothetical protein [Frankia]CAJ62517.1 hypothetical protein FRAAL3874 [Frankia alni ACN14a]
MTGTPAFSQPEMAACRRSYGRRASLNAWSTYRGAPPDEIDVLFTHLHGEVAEPAE